MRDDRNCDGNTRLNRTQESRCNRGAVTDVVQSIGDEESGRQGPTDVPRLFMMVMTNEPLDNYQRHESAERPAQRISTEALDGFRQNVPKHGAKERTCSKADQPSLMPGAGGLASTYGCTEARPCGRPANAATTPAVT